MLHWTFLLLFPCWSIVILICRFYSKKKIAKMVLFLILYSWLTWKLLCSSQCLLNNLNIFLEMITSYISKNNTHFRKYVSTIDRFAITLTDSLPICTTIHEVSFHIDLVRVQLVTSQTTITHSKSRIETLE